MSEDLERIVRGCYEAYNRGDLEEAARFMAPDVVWDSGETSLLGDSVHGPEAVVERLRPDIFSSQRADLLKVEVNDPHVFVEMRFHAVGSGSGVTLVTLAWQVWTVKEGLAVRVQNFLNRDQARAAAGVEAKPA